MKCTYEILLVFSASAERQTLLIKNLLPDFIVALSKVKFPIKSSTLTSLGITWLGYLWVVC